MNIKIMKKIFLLFTAVAMSAGVVFAQDINQATENYNNGAMELDMGNKEAALACFQSSLTMAEALGEEGAELAANCKSIIPNVMLSIAKDLLKSDNYDGALEQIAKATEAAELYGNADVVAEAKELVPGAYIAKGQSLLKAKNVAGAAGALQKAIEIDPTNGVGQLLYGQVLGAMGKTADAEAAYVKAMENGMENKAKPALVKMFQKLAQTALKGKKYQEVLDLTAKANSYMEDANSYNFAAKASQQLGKTADCIANYQKYLELKPNAKDAAGVKFTIAALYQQLGNKDKAKEYYQLVTSDPEFGAEAQKVLKTL